MLYNNYFTLEVDKRANSESLLDQWRFAEIQKRFWSQRNPERNLVAEKQLHNINLIMQQLWEELTNRCENFPTAALMLLIETGASFSMNLNPKP